MFNSGYLRNKIYATRTFLKRVIYKIPFISNIFPCPEKILTGTVLELNSNEKTCFANNEDASEADKTRVSLSIIV